jgi:hypothetical protein
MSAIFMLFDVIGALPIVTYYWRRSTTIDKSPSDLVTTLGATAMYELRVPTAFRFSNYDIEVVSAFRTGSGKIDSHLLRLTLRSGPYNFF